MRAWMRISVIGVVVSTFMFSSKVFALDADLNAHFAPGADGHSVSLSTSVKIPSTKSQTGTTVSAGGAQKLSPLVWSKIYLPVPAGSGPECDPASSGYTQGAGLTFGPIEPDGLLALGTYKNRVTGAVVRQSVYCIRAGTPTIPSHIPVAPTYAQIWNAMYSNAFNDASTSSGAYVAPASPGLTGLPTHIWAEFPDSQSIVRDVALPNGYRLRATASITNVMVTAKSPKGRVITLANLLPNASGSIDGGSFESPPVTHVFSATGNYVITTAVVWTANNATLTGPGIGALSVPLGSIRLEINRPYVVQQLKPALTK